MAVFLPCPDCTHEVEVSEEDQDASLSDLWSHAQGHGGTRGEIEARFIKAQGNARDG